VLKFYGKDGKAYATLGILVDSPAGVATTLLLSAKPEPTGSLIAVVSTDESVMLVSDGKSQVSLQAKGEGARLHAPGLLVGEVEGRPLIALSDKDGKGRCGLLLAPDGSPNIRLLDQGGEVVWTAP
jgi:hypothetical protein